MTDAQLRDIWETTWRFVVVMVMLLIFLMCVEADAQKLCHPDRPEHCAQPLKLGEKAPFAGQLLTTRLALDQATRAHGCAETTDIAVGEVRETLQLKLNAEMRYRAIDSRTALMREELLQNRLQEAQAAAVRSWRDDPRLWFVLGVLGGVGATVAAVYAGVRVVEVAGH